MRKEPLILEEYSCGLLCKYQLTRNLETKTYQIFDIQGTKFWDNELYILVKEFSFGENAEKEALKHFKNLIEETLEYWEHAIENELKKLKAKEVK